jgi:mRNA interferase RelE/StbE
LYKIFLSKTAEKEYSYLCKTNRAIFERIRSALAALSENPNQGKPLKSGLKGLWSYRVGMYRIIYSIEHRQLSVYIIDIGHRREIYR